MVASDPVELLVWLRVTVGLTHEEAGYVAAARTQQTTRGYKSD